MGLIQELLKQFGFVLLVRFSTEYIITRLSH